MKIFYDYQALSGQNFGGVSRIYTELNRYLSIEHEITNGLIYSDNHYAGEVIKNLKRLNPKVNSKYRGKIQNVINRTYSIKQLLSNKYDIVHPTYYGTYFLPFMDKKTPYIVTLLDMIHESGLSSLLKVKDNTSEKKLLICQRAKKVIAISESTKIEFLKFYPDFDDSKIEVIHLANSLNVNNFNSDEIKLPNLPEKYILFVGRRWYYKNFNKIISIIKDLLLDSQNLHFVCAGGGDFTVEELKFIKSCGLSSKIIHIPFNDDNTLSYLYKNALFFTFPSQNEGFGIPVLESFSCGCPALLNNMTSLPEIGGEAASYFNIDNKIDTLNSFENMIKDERLRKTLSIAGLNREKLFTWQKCASEHTNIYNRCI